MMFEHVYACVTRYQLLCAILHRRAHPEGSALLLVLNLTFADEELKRLLSELRQTAVFDQVRAYNERGVWDGIAKAAVGTTVKPKAGALIEERHMPIIALALEAHFDKTVGEVANEETRWYVAADHYSVGMALVIKGIPYTQFEDHSGGYEDPSLQLATFERLNPFQYKVHGYLADARRVAIASYVVDTISRPTVPNGDRVEELKVRETLDALESDALVELRAIFDYHPNLEDAVAGDVAILITQPFGRWKFLDWENQKTLYYMLVDYFAPDSRLIVKPHPQDDLTPYAQWFPDSELAPAKVPMELVLTTVKPSLALTVGSTAIFPLRNSRTETVFLGQGFERVYEQLPRLKGMATALGWLGASEIDFADVFPRDALTALIQSSATTVSKRKPSVLVCWADAPTELALDSYDVVASLTPMRSIAEGVQERHVVVRRRQARRAHSSQSLVYFYSRDSHVFDAVKGKTLEHSLPNLKEDLTIVFPADEDRMFLQAQVASLEARVMDLTERLREKDESSAQV